MAEHPNATLVRGMFAAFRDADAAKLHELIAEDAVWHFPGRRGQLAGDHRGRPAILAFLLKVVALTGGTFHLDLIDVAASDANAVALFRGHATRGDRTLDNPTCLRLRIADGKVQEAWEFVWDLEHVDEFWR